MIFSVVILFVQFSQLECETIEWQPHDRKIVAIDSFNQSAAYMLDAIATSFVPVRQKYYHSREQEIKQRQLTLVRLCPHKPEYVYRQTVQM